ncbi:hypothetical protein [Streptococcus halichoeri]|uniref:hypothetical protein n=1 Tax=Streptococcus halichoeri TaxID=254785 RepID=UPI001C8EEA22|nr:hypothetical protein [Streptococcus halichoeri]
MLTLSKQCIKKSALLIVALVGLGTYGQAAQANTQWEDYKAQMVNSYYDSDYRNIDKSVRYSKDIKTDTDGKQYIHWTVNFNPTRERWNYLRAVMFLPKEAKPTTIKMGAWYQNYQNNTWKGNYYHNAVYDHKTEDLLKQPFFSSTLGSDYYAVSYHDNYSDFADLWSNTIQQTQEGNSLSNFNAIKDEGRFDLAFVQYAKRIIADTVIYRWEFDTPITEGVETDNIPFIVGVIGEANKYPRFLGEMERQKIKIGDKGFYSSHYHFRNPNDNYVWIKRWGDITTQVKEQILNKVEIEKDYVPLDLFSIRQEANNESVIVLPQVVRVDSAGSYAGQTLPETEPSLKDKIKRYYPNSYRNWYGYRRH